MSYTIEKQYFTQEKKNRLEGSWNSSFASAYPSRANDKLHTANRHYFSQANAVRHQPGVVQGPSRRGDVVSDASTGTKAATRVLRRPRETKWCSRFGKTVSTVNSKIHTYQRNFFDRPRDFTVDGWVHMGKDAKRVADAERLGSKPPPAPAYQRRLPSKTPRPRCRAASASATSIANHSRPATAPPALNVLLDHNTFRLYTYPTSPSFAASPTASTALGPRLRPSPNPFHPTRPSPRHATPMVRPPSILARPTFIIDLNEGGAATGLVYPDRRMPQVQPPGQVIQARAQAKPESRQGVRDSRPGRPAVLLV